MANELEVRIDEKNLPTNIEDLTKFALIGREKLNAVRAEIRAIDKVGLAKEVHEQKLAEAQDIADAVLDAEMRIGELAREIPKAKGGEQFHKTTHSNTAKSVTKNEVIKKSGFKKDQINRFEQLAKNPEIVQKVKAEARENGEIVTRQAVLNEIKKQKKEAEIEKAKESIASQRKEKEQAVLYVGNGIGFIPNEPYDLLLTDPPYMTDVDDIESFANSWLPNALSHVKDTGFAFVFIGAYPKELRAYLNIEPPSHLVLEQQLIWTYRNTLGQNPKGRYKLNYQSCLFYKGINAPDLDCPLTNEQWAVQDINAPDGRIGDRYHEWQKPLEIAERFIRHTTKKSDTVFDPFACTGTFLLAAASLGRKGYGFEIMQKNAEIAESRGVVIG